MYLPFLEQYEGQSTSELIKLRGKFRTDSLVMAFEEALSSKEVLTDEELVVLAVEAMEREVNNGGFSQLFCNSSNQYVPLLVSALNVIGCPSTAVMVQEAIELLGVEGDLSPLTLEAAVVDADEELFETLSELDTRYYKGADEPICEKLFDYIEANSGRITLRA